MLNLRMANPKILIDISGLESLKGIQKTGDVVRIGALTTHHEVLSSSLVQTHVPLLAQAVPYVAHLAIRNKGTIGGSLALGDPAAEYPAVALALNATLVIQSANGERRVKATDFSSACTAQPCKRMKCSLRSSFLWPLQTNGLCFQNWPGEKAITPWWAWPWQSA